MQILILLSLVGVAISNSYVRFEKNEVEFVNDAAWQVWKSGHNKAYEDIGEEKVRYQIWKNNFKKIIEHNQRSKSMFLAMNHFGDMTTLEFKSTMNGYFRAAKKEGSTFMEPLNMKHELPKNVDWRKHGLVSEVKNQGHCGSCWAFSTTGSLEGQYRRKHNKSNIDLSEQNLVDCSTPYGNHGCQGGLMDNAFKYIRDNGGIDTETSYPYEAQQGDCRFREKTIGATDTGFVDVKQEDEEALKKASATVGPISVAIDASHFSFQFYHKGVYDEPNCSPTRLDHGVLMVGYGEETDEEGEVHEYWIVKNSWGPKWGEGGFVRMSRNKENQCGIASAASYPLI